MPIEIIDLNEGKGNAIIGSGILTGNEYIDALKKHLAQDEEKLKAYMFSLTDYSAVTRVEEEPNSVVQLSVDLCIRVAAINPHVIVAIVADKDILFGLSRMWESLVDRTGWQTNVFKTRDAAETWVSKKVQERFGVKNLTIG